MPLIRQITSRSPSAATAAPVVFRAPPGTVQQTFAAPFVNRVTGELANVVAKYKDQPGLFTMGNAPSFSAGRLPLGILIADLCLGGGFKLSRGSMLYGEKSTGKSTLAARTIASAQRAFPDSIAVLIDLEGTFDENWGQVQGIDLSRLLKVEPESGEAAVDIADAVFRTSEVSIVVTDSIAMLVPMVEIKASAVESLVGVHARLVGNYLRRLTSAMLVERHRGHTPLLLYINQFRMKIGVNFGDPRTLPGGKALEFCTSQQVQTYNKEVKFEPKGATEANLQKGLVMHNEHEIHITKDKTGGKLKAGKFKLIRDPELTGLPAGYIEQPRTIVNWGLPSGIVSGKYQLGQYGSFKSFDDINRFFVEQPLAERDLQAQILAYWTTKWNITQ